jgi:hypothetical protein
MNQNEGIHTIGYAKLQVREADGSLVYDEIHKNTLTNYAKNASAQLWIGTTIAPPSKIEFGQGSPTLPLTGTDPTDTALWTPVAASIQAVSFSNIWLTYNSQYSTTYNAGVLTATSITFTEVGLFDASMNLWSHIALNNFLVTSSQSVTVQWQVAHTGS